MKKRLLIPVLFSVILIFYSNVYSQAGDILIIANNSVAVDQLSRDDIADIFQNEKIKWEDGKTISVAMLIKGMTHRKFTNDILGCSPGKLRNIWKRVIFTGSGKLPMFLHTEEIMVKAIRKKTGAIGYIQSDTPHEGVKIISVK